MSASEFGQAEATNVPKTSVDELAERLAEVVGFNPGDPINEVVEKFGGTVEYSGFGETCDGSIIVEGEGDFTIFLSPYTSRLRDRFTVAHELGHYFLHSDMGKKKIKQAREGSDRVEWEANWFAAGFLMPKTVFAKKAASSSDAALADEFDVSLEAAAVRRKALDL